MISNMGKEVRYIVLEKNVYYDWDDYRKVADIVYDLDTDSILTPGTSSSSDIEKSSCKVDFSEVNWTNELIEKVIKGLIDSFSVYYDALNLEDYISCVNLYDVAIPVKVVGGRKYKGDAILVGGMKKMINYGLAAYQPHNWKYIPQIIANGELQTITNFTYLELPKEFVNNYKEYVFKHIEKTLDTISTLAHTHAYKISYAGCDRQYYLGNVSVLNRKAFNEFKNIPENLKNEINVVKTAIEAKEKEARQKLYDEKLPEVTVWANGLGKSEEETQLIIERTMKKYYAV